MLSLIRKLIAALEANTHAHYRSQKIMTQASDNAKAAADRIVAVTESLLAAVQKAATDLAAAIAAGASASDPAFQAIADELNAEADKANTALSPAPPQPSA